MDFPLTLLSVIKKRFEETNGCCEMGGCESESMAPFYVRHLEDNLVQAMNPLHREEYKAGVGIELGEKMRALRSSSAMTFNLLGNRDVRGVDSAALPPGRYTVQYEYQLPTLRKNPNKANLDARLVSDDGNCVVYCEMKMAEWLLGWMKMLRVSYLNPERYLIPAGEAMAFIALFENLIVPEANMKGSHRPRFERFDALQMTKHLLAIYSGLESEPAHTIKLINCVWEIRETKILASHELRYIHMLATEQREFEEFVQIAEPVFDLFKKRGIDFSLEYMSVEKLLACLDKNEEQRRRLARYTL